MHTCIPHLCEVISTRTCVQIDDIEIAQIKLHCIHRENYRISATKRKKKNILCLMTFQVDYPITIYKIVLSLFMGDLKIYFKQIKFPIFSYLNSVQTKCPRFDPDCIIFAIIMLTSHNTD